MQWEIKGCAECPASKPWGLVANGSVKGCFASRAEARSAMEVKFDPKQRRIPKHNPGGGRWVGEGGGLRERLHQAGQRFLVRHDLASPDTLLGPPGPGDLHEGEHLTVDNSAFPERNLDLSDAERERLRNRGLPLSAHQYSPGPQMATFVREGRKPNHAIVRLEGSSYHGRTDYEVPYSAISRL